MYLEYKYILPLLSSFSTIASFFVNMMMGEESYRQQPKAMYLPSSLFELLIMNHASDLLLGGKGVSTFKVFDKTSP